MQQVEANGLSYHLPGKILASGFYLNELLIHLLHRHDPHGSIFQIYADTLAQLHDAQQHEACLRLFEKQLLIELGYGLLLDRTVSGEPVVPTESYIFNFGIGCEKVAAPSAQTFLGSELLALHHGKFISSAELLVAKKILRSALAALLGSHPIRSREMLGSILL